MYSILGKLQALQPTPAEVVKEKAQAIRESVDAQGSILSGVSAVQAKLAKSFAESDFSKMSKAIQKTGKSKASADAITAAAGREKLGQKEMTRRSVAGRKDEATETCSECGMNEGECEHTMEGDEQFHSDRVALLGKVNKVIQGIQTPEQYKNSLGFVKRAFAKLNDQPGGPDFNSKTIQRINQDARALNADLAAKAKELGIEPQKFLEAEITRTPGKTVHRKTEFPGYPTDDNDDIEDTNKGQRGRPRKHAVKAQKLSATGEKLGRGRPKKDAPVGSNAPKINDPFGRTPDKAPKSKIKGRVHTMEGINFKRMAEETNMSIDEMLDTLNNDIKVYKTTGECSPTLRDFLEVHAHTKRQMADEALGVGHDLVTPQQRVAQATPQKPGVMGAIKDVAQGAKNWIQGKPEQGPTYEEVDPLASELNELAKLAGLSTEGNAFTGKLKSTPKGGKFDLDGKEYTDTSTLDEEPNEGNEFSGALARAKASHADKFNVDGKEYPVKEADAPVDEPVEDELANEPKEKYATIKSITSQGDDLNRQKRQDPGTANRAANPLTNAPIKLEAKLAQEYESIKKVSK